MVAWQPRLSGLYLRLASHMFKSFPARIKGPVAEQPYTEQPYSDPNDDLIGTVGLI